MNGVLFVKPFPERRFDAVPAGPPLDDKRKDEIEVVVTSLAGALSDEKDMLEAERKASLEQLARNSSLGLGAVVALIIAAMVLLKMKPVTVTVPPDETISLERARVFAELSRKVQSDPEAMKAIVSSWLDEGEVGNRRSTDRPGDRGAERRAA